MGGAGVCLTPARAAAKETKGTEPLHLNKHKALGPDELSNWLFKECAELLAQPASDILFEFFIYGTKVTLCEEACVCNPSSKRQASLRP